MITKHFIKVLIMFASLILFGLLSALLVSYLEEENSSLVEQVNIVEIAN
jgi:hypothetical protein